MKHALLISSVLVACAAAAGTMQAADPQDSGAAAAYCEHVGGTVINRLPVFGTNGPPSSWLLLTGPRQFCQFTSPTDGSRIHILVQTLYATTPTLAALAITPKSNPPGAAAVLPHLTIAPSWAAPIRLAE